MFHLFMLIVKIAFKRLIIFGHITMSTRRALAVKIRYIFFGIYALCFYLKFATEGRMIPIEKKYMDVFVTSLFYT